MSRVLRALVFLLAFGLAPLARADVIEDSHRGHDAPERRPVPEADAGPIPVPDATADGHAAHAARPDAHAPIGVMGDHIHPAGEFMLSYRFHFMQMVGNRDGTDRLSAGEVLRQFPVTPTSMDMSMHMFGLMWAPHERVTLSGMLPIVRKRMEHVTRGGRKFTTRSDGIGDFKLTALVSLWKNETHHVHLNAGVSFPTGEVDVSDRTPLGVVRLPYPMQLGSGTYDILPGMTYNGQLDAFSWGAQATGVVRTGRNEEGYAFGNRYQVTSWVARKWLPWLSTSFRLAYDDWGNVRGRDDLLNPRLIPTADPDLRAGRRLNALLGINFIVTRGFLKGNRFAVEAGTPVWQNLRGPQLETDWNITAGWQLAF